MITRLAGIVAVLIFSATSVQAQGPTIPPGDKEPLLRLEAEGPTSFVTSLTFSPDGKRLYAAGFDKVVRVWTANAKGQFELDKASYRVPIGPGIDGTINTIALSPDERWLAVAGQGIVRGAADFRRPGLVIPKTGGFTEAMWRDQGTIYVFNTQNKTVHALRGHMGPVISLAFAPAQEGKPVLLISAGRDRNMETHVYEGAVRVWDIEKGTVVERRSDLPNQDFTRPALTAWHTGKALKQLRVGIAWEDGKLRVWDLATNKLTEARDGFNGEKDGMFNNTVAYLPEQKRLITLSRRQAVGTTRGAAQMQSWTIDAAAPQADKNAQYRLTEGDFRARSLALASSQAGKATDLAAVAMEYLVVDQNSRQESHYLYLYDLDPDNFGKRKARVLLWEGANKLPALTTAVGGRFIAVAGNNDHSIHVFAVKDLLEKQDEARPQVLQNVGVALRFVAFVKKGKDRGLLLSKEAQPVRGGKPREPQKGDVVFHLTDRNFSEKLDGWEIDAPDTEGWTLRHTQARVVDGKPAPGVVTVRRGDAEPVTIKMASPREVISDYALLPAMAPLNVPIVAVAYHDLGQPALRLYNARTGEEVRWYTGHSERILNLAFSGDGRFLASVAEDLTVNVWSMAKLDKYMPKLGMIPGLAVRNVIIVSAVDKGGAAAGKLQPLDVIEGMLDDDGKLDKYFSLRGLFRAIEDKKPGEKVTLRVRSGDKERDVVLTVGANIVDQTRAMLLGLGAQDPVLVTNLVNAAHQFSPLPGISVRHAPSVVLSPVENLAKDDLIEGIVEDGKVRVLPSAFDFYEAVALAGPRTKITLRVQGKGNVAVNVGQGIDERKPLFSLFVTGGPRVDQWEWIGWSPIGPYEASDRKAERYIGWHFNTGDPLAPASFALADQYRKEYYREGILRHLMARGELAPALKDLDDIDKRKNLPMPKMTLWIDEVGPDPSKLDPQGRFVIRQLPAVLKLAIDDFPLDRVESLEYQVNGGGRVAFPRGLSAREKTAQLELNRGVSRIRVVMKTYEAQPQEWTQDIVVRTVPPAPVVAKSDLPPRKLVDAPAFPLQALIQAGRADEEVQVTLLHRRNEEVIAKKEFTLGKAKKDLEISEKLQLEPGDNLIEVVAVNKGAAPDREELETRRIAGLITYVPKKEEKAAPPLISLKEIVPLQRESQTPIPAIKVVAGQKVVVTEPTVRLVGEINAEKQNLSRAGWKLKEKSGELAKFVADKANKFTISQELKLEPGEQKIAVVSKTATSDLAELSLTIEYRPQLPKVSFTVPAEPIYADGKKAPSVKLNGVFANTNGAPAVAEILLNDQDKAVAQLPVTKDGEWSTFVEGLQPGDNRIRVRMKNEWGQVSTSEPAHVRYLRPPQDIRFQTNKLKTDKGKVDLTATVKSPLPLIRETIEAEVNGREIASVEMEKAADDTWTIKLRDVSLDPQANEVNLWVSNLEAKAVVPGKATVFYTPPMNPPPRPEVELLDPIKDVNVTEPDFPVRFRVKSKSALKRVELVREGRVPLRESFNVADLKPDAQGSYEFQKVVNLIPRENRLRVVALNDGGEQDSSVVVNYLYMPVRLTIDQVQPLARNAKPIPPKVLPDGKLVFPTVPDGRVTLTGKVTWSKDNDEQLKKISLVRIFVNGFQQIPAELKPPTGNSREREFRAELLLNRPENNQVEIELPDLKQDSSNRREFPLACAKPEPGQRLHMLIVGVGEKDEDKLTDQALLALRAQKEKGEVKTPAFASVRTYGPLTGFVSPEQVFTQLCLIKKTIDVLAAEGSPNDVVMVYYQGGEAVKADGNFFETSVSKYDKELRRSGITFRGLQGFFDETLGAKLLMLDVARVTGDQQVRDEVAKVAPNTYFSILRYKWLSTQREGGLLVDWKKAMDMDKRGVLESVTGEVAKFFKQHPSLAYDRYVPNGLADLLVDEKR